MQSELTPEKRAELRAKAEAATPGPWSQWKDHAAVFAGAEENDNTHLSGKCLAKICRCESDDLGEDEEDGDAMAKANAAHIAAFDRETCLTLLDAAEERDRLRKRIAELEANLARLARLALANGEHPVLADVAHELLKEATR